MSTSVLDAFISALPPGKRGGNGWISFNCPSCGDTRSRGGFLILPSGGWRYRCFNGGCEFNDQTTGWEPGNGIGGRPRKLFTLLGGSLSDIPIELLMRGSAKFNRAGDMLSDGSDAPRPTHFFPAIPLPPNTVPVLEPGEHIDDPGYQAVFEWLVERGEELITRHPYMWSAEHKYSLITPYMHMKQIVGYLVRDVRKNSKTRMWQKCHTDYVFNQESLLKSGRRAIVTEGVNDAIATAGVGVRGSRMTKQQILLLKESGRDIVVLPDLNPSGLGLIADAEENDWFISTPDWDKDVDDSTKAVGRYGLLYVVESIMKSSHKNYLSAYVRCRVSRKT